MLSKLRRVLLILSAVICCWSQAAFSEEARRVIVLPFEIHAREAIPSLGEQVSEMVAKSLAADGAEVVDPGNVILPESRSGLRKLGIKNSVDYVIRGSLTRVGERISLDAEMIPSVGGGDPEVFFAEGAGMGELPRRAKELSTAVAMKLFKRLKVAKVLVAGNKRIEDDAVKRMIKTVPGDVYMPGKLSEDLKAIFAMGYFDDIRVEAEKDPRGMIVIFNVTEKPTVRAVRTSGNKVYDDEKILENLDISTGSILNSSKINDNVKRLELLYQEKSYHDTKVTHRLTELPNNQVDLTFEIEEGEKVRIKSIVFEGNEAFTDKKLKKAIKTSEKDWLSWITASGELSEDELSMDVGRLGAFYMDRGYITAKVSDPEVEYKGSWIYIKFKVSEGPQFTVTGVDFNGDLIMEREALDELIKAETGEVYNRSLVEGDTRSLMDAYSDKGYANARVVPKVDKDMEKAEVRLTFDINKGKLMYFERIKISGNTKTRDKIIRRELAVYEKGLYSGKKLKRSIRNLKRLDYFEDVKADTLPGSGDDQLLLNVNVTEKPTGTFSFGGGYSSVDNLFFMASVTQRNLFGRGQILNVKAELGGSSNRYSIGFTEPWINDIPLSGTVELFKWEKEYDDYDKESTGGTIRMGYPVFDFTRAYIGYTYDDADISNIDDEAAKSIKELEGKNLTSSITASIKYDSRDKAFNTTEGSMHSFSVEYAGGFLGGDIAFTKYTLESGWYFPLPWEFVAFVRGKGGYVQRNSEGLLPDYERFYLGGINSVRGFDWQDIHAEDDEGDEIGGDKFVQFNFELIFPLLKDVGIKGLVFYDTGNVFGQDDDFDFGDLRSTVGYGFRWYSPMGPIRVEYGHILDKEDGDDSGRWEFSMGSSF